MKLKVLLFWILGFAGAQTTWSQLTAAQVASYSAAKLETYAKSAGVSVKDYWGVDTQKLAAMTQAEI